jgi:hypothetical protein
VNGAIIVVVVVVVDIIMADIEVEGNLVVKVGFDIEVDIRAEFIIAFMVIALAVNQVNWDIEVGIDIKVIGTEVDLDKVEVGPDN